MTAKLIADLCAGRFVDPATGRKPAIGVREVAIDRGLIATAGDRLHSLAIGRDWLLIADSASEAAAGDAIRRSLEGRFRLSRLTFAGRALPTIANRDRVAEAAVKADGVIAIGSGAINDLAKSAAFRCERPYVVFGTAPSMNGYVSMSASLLQGQHKISEPARPPVAVFLDLDCLAAAPPRMIRAGLGDSLCRSTAEADWHLSHSLLGTPFDPLPFLLLEASEDRLFENAAGLMRGDHEALRALAETLILSGFGMTIAGGSYPASQSEHLIAHYAEMLAPALPPPGLPETFHGEEIAVATIAIAQLQDDILAGPPPVPAIEDWTEGKAIAHFGPRLGPLCWRDYRKKALAPEMRAALGERLAKDWPAIAARIAARRKPAFRLDRVMRDGGGPNRPRDIGWSDDFFRRALLHARFIRDRFGFLDLAAACGRLETWVRSWRP